MLQIHMVYVERASEARMHLFWCWHTDIGVLPGPIGGSVAQADYLSNISQNMSSPVWMREPMVICMVKVLLWMVVCMDLAERLKRRKHLLHSYSEEEIHVRFAVAADQFIIQYQRRRERIWLLVTTLRTLAWKLHFKGKWWFCSQTTHPDTWE